jgi:hypothetical protein
MAAAAEALKLSPLARVKEEFGGKDKLVDKIVGVLDSGDESKDELRKRLLGVSNTKLIRLHSVATRTKQAGGHGKLVATAAERMKHGKDKDYVQRLSGFSNGRLLDMAQAAEGRGNGAVAKPAAPMTSAAVKAAHAERKATRKGKVQKKAPPKKAAAKPTARSKKSAAAKSKKRR